LYAALWFVGLPVPIGEMERQSRANSRTVFPIASHPEKVEHPAEICFWFFDAASLI
jgi:hypothetical protein